MSTGLTTEVEGVIKNVYEFEKVYYTSEPASGTTLTLATIDDFRDGTQKVVIGGVTYSVSNIDLDAQTITLSQALPASIPIGTAVVPVPARRVTIATVSLYGGTQTIDCEVLAQSAAVLPLGTRAAGTEEVVRLRRRGLRFVVDDVTANETQLRPDIVEDVIDDILPGVIDQALGQTVPQAIENALDSTTGEAKDFVKLVGWFHRGLGYQVAGGNDNPDTSLSGALKFKAEPGYTYRICYSLNWRCNTGMWFHLTAGEMTTAISAEAPVGSAVFPDQAVASNWQHVYKHSDLNLSENSSLYRMNGQFTVGSWTEPTAVLLGFIQNTTPSANAPATSGDYSYTNNLYVSVERFGRYDAFGDTSPYQDSFLRSSSGGKFYIT